MIEIIENSIPIRHAAHSRVYPKLIQPCSTDGKEEMMRPQIMIPIQANKESSCRLSFLTKNITKPTGSIAREKL